MKSNNTISQSNKCNLLYLLTLVGLHYIVHILSLFMTLASGSIYGIRLKDPGLGLEGWGLALKILVSTTSLQLGVNMLKQCSKQLLSKHTSINWSPNILRLFHVFVTFPDTPPITFSLTRTVPGLLGFSKKWSPWQLRCCKSQKRYCAMKQATSSPTNLTLADDSRVISLFGLVFRRVLTLRILTGLKE